ncbi:anti-phage ZorAB system protein ZorA [Novosphingobium sp. BW1]|uniref:anti-phage ZorAB system protein ZorA n=1 Tax=Novosphingobium sp. BW1 TaxID=2592621 RepID=UPI001396BF21|nr:anti-phage ZorAB system protein ZorA [Novosphingobium sp. BW1]
MDEMEFFGIPVIPVFVFLILLSLGFAFVRYFFVPAKRLDTSLKQIIETVEATRERGSHDLSKCFDPDPAIAAIWNEYQETLHVQKDIDTQSGEMVEKAIRSTVPAEMFFSPHAVVDNRVHAEFFKHLPGIFTGVGIIGTFTGLLTGLSSFQISDDSGVVRNSLTALLHGVSEAFVVSAFAIVLAMLTTGLEKFRLNSLYRKVTQLAHEIDATYEAGAGEEYLARLVNSSEESASQTRILKDALVSDLKEILTDLAVRQIAATVQRSNELGTTIAGALTEALKAPLDQIAGAVGQVSQDQSSAVTKLLTDVLASFSDRLENMFGSQLSGIGDMQQRTIDAMQTAVSKLQDLTSTVEAAGTRASDTMSAKLIEVVQAVEAKQAAMSDELRTVIDEIKSSTGEMQEATQNRVQDMLTTLGDTMAQTISALERQAADRSRLQAEEDGRRAEAAAGHVGQMREAVGEISSNVDGLVVAIQEMTAGVQSATRDAFARLNGGADTLLAAANKFESSGRDVVSGFDRIANVTTGLSEAAGSVTGAARSLDSVVSDYRSARDAVAAMVQDLRGTVENASREASLTADVLNRIEGATQKLVAAQAEANEFLDEVAEVIGESHEKFSEGMRSTVVEANRQFHSELTQATGLLKEAIQELEFALPSGGRQAA